MIAIAFTLVLVGLALLAGYEMGPPVRPVSVDPARRDEAVRQLQEEDPR